MNRPPISDEVQAFIFEVVQRALMSETDLCAVGSFGRWVEGRAASISQVLSVELVGYCHRHGDVELAVREPDDVTEELNLNGGPNR